MKPHLSEHCLNVLTLDVPGEPVPVLKHPLSEETFPNIQSKPPLMQPHAVPSSPYQLVIPSTPPHDETVDHDEVAPQSPLL